MTPYETKISALDTKASQMGFIKYQVSGFAPAATANESNDAESDDDDKPPSAATLSYFNKQSEEDIAKMKFLLIPQMTLDRATSFRRSLCRCGQQSGKYTSFSGSRGDSRRMVYKISEWMRNCNELFKTSESLGLYELTAITMACFQVPWWVQDTWHVSKYTRIAISSALSIFGKRHSSLLLMRKIRMHSLHFWKTSIVRGKILVSVSRQILPT
jgi:hypothetical protein